MCVVVPIIPTDHSKSNLRCFQFCEWAVNPSFIYKVARISDKVSIYSIHVYCCDPVYKSDSFRILEKCMIYNIINIKRKLTVLFFDGYAPLV